MYWNRLIFPAPEASYTIHSHEGEIIWIPKLDENLAPKGQAKSGKKGEKQSKDLKRHNKAVCTSWLTMFKPKKARAQNAKSTGDFEGYLEVSGKNEEEQKVGDPYQEDPTKDPNAAKKKGGHKTMCFSFFKPKPKVNKEKHSKTNNPVRFYSPRNARSPHARSGYETPQSEDAQNGFEPRPKKGSDYLRRPDPQSLEISSESSEDDDISNVIPCLLLQSPTKSSKLLLFFHANCEDISQTYDLLVGLRQQLMINLIAVEYPGYGVYKGSPSATKVLEDAEIVWNFLTTVLKIEPKDIILMGRSIGSGPATHLASKVNPGALILISPFTSLKSVAKHLFGALAGVLVKERFKNLSMIADVTCPCLFIHGKSDQLVPVEHSQALKDACRAPCQLVVNDTMEHNEFDLLFDMVVPISNFLKAHHVLEEKEARPIEFPRTLFVYH